MQVHISIGENHRFELREALLVYGDRQRSFVTRHQVTLRKDAPPTLEPARPLTLGFLESLARSLGGSSTAEVLPENVLGERRPHDRVVDASLQAPDVLRELRTEGGKVERPHLSATPPLVWRVDNEDLRIRALAENKRPVAGTTLAVVPFWNLSDDGRVCTGSDAPPQSCYACRLNARLGAGIL